MELTTSPHAAPVSVRPRLVDIGDASPTQAAFIYAASGVPVAPFDPSEGKGKSCGNRVGSDRASHRWYEQVTTDVDQLKSWLDQFGDFQALATSPGAIDFVVLDMDKPDRFPKRLRTHLEDPSVPFVATRPAEHHRRGHYWFRLPKDTLIGNPAFRWGEVRGVGGGIVLPPYGDRCVVRAGQPPILPNELLAEIVAKGSGSSAGAGGGDVDLKAFCRLYRNTIEPKKLTGVIRLHEYCLHVKGLPPHTAMLQTLLAGLGEAKIGYIPAADVLGSMRKRWGSRPNTEFVNLARWCAAQVLATPVVELKAKSDRKQRADSRGSRQTATSNPLEVSHNRPKLI